MEKCLKCRLQKFCKEVYGVVIGGDYNMPPCATPESAELAATDSQQLKAEIRSLIARYDGFRMNDGEKAPGWLLHELRELSAV